MLLVQVFASAWSYRSHFTHTPFLALSNQAGQSDHSYLVSMSGNCPKRITSNKEHTIVTIDTCEPESGHKLWLQSCTDQAFFNVMVFYKGKDWENVSGNLSTKNRGVYCEGDSILLMKDQTFENKQGQCLHPVILPVSKNFSYPDYFTKPVWSTQAVYVPSKLVAY